ncbi:MAG TPA: 50S ribosomal protein L13 [Anaerolineae bacterium]
MKTYNTTKEEIKHDWFVVDATGHTLGRLASRVAAVLRGKHKPIFTPWLDCGDFVIVVNAEKIKVTGNRLESKMYYRHSGYIGGLKQITLRQQLEKHPERVLQAAVRGMLPNNRLGRKMVKKLKVYAGDEHPHAAQQPKKLEL